MGSSGGTRRKPARHLPKAGTAADRDDLLRRERQEALSMGFEGRWARVVGWIVGAVFVLGIIGVVVLTTIY